MERYLSDNRMRVKKTTPALKKQSKKGVKAAFPSQLAPMLATLTDKPRNESGWLYEVKWDGYRAVAFLNKKNTHLISRNNKSFDKKFYSLLAALRQWNVDAVVDGEVVVLNENGVSSFSNLQNWKSEADGTLIYYVFDLLWYKGNDLTKLPLSERRELLSSILPDNDKIRLSETFQSSFEEFLYAASQLGLEGIIAKKADSLYYPGERSKEWLKIKINKRHEVVIAGYTQNEDSSKLFSSLLVGVYENGQLHYTGKIGTGFSDSRQKELIKLFKPLIIKKSAFITIPDINKPSRFRPNPPKATATWLSPKLVCEVSYAEITEDGVMRHPSFEGLREDKNAKDVVREPVIATKVPKTGSINKKVKGMLKPSVIEERSTLLNPSEESQERSVNKHTLKFSNLSKTYWPKEHVTKRDMINYYYQVAPYILPYLKDRPQSLNRYPNGINGKSFYQKDVTGKAPDWIKLYPYHTSDNQDKNFMVCTDEASLLYMANLGCIEMNPWNSRISKPGYPDWCIIDLDPTEKNTFEQVIQTAQVTRQVLEGIGVTAYPKTSGSTGMHIYIPLHAKYTYDQCQLFGKWIAQQVHAELSSFTSIERMTNNRKGKLYIDYLQNRPKATLAAPYSLRPKPGATVSMPLYWEEVKKGLKMNDFTINNAVERIQSEGDIFKPILGKGIDLKKIMKKWPE
jgi:bifunctional non-homologous end joining protein LigD